MIRVLFIALSLVIVKQFIVKVEEHDRSVPEQREPSAVRRYNVVPVRRMCDATFIQHCGEPQVLLAVESRERQPPQVEACAHDIGSCKHIPLPGEET